MVAFELVRLSDENEWLAEKKFVIGSSESAGLFGLGYSCQSVYAMWLEKSKDVRVPFGDDIQRVLQYGKLAEPFLRESFMYETGRPLRWDDGYCLRRSIDYPFLSATLDAWIEQGNESEAVELKFLGVHQRYEISQGVPNKFMIQIQHQLACTGWEKGWLFGMCANEPFIYEIPRHDKMIKAIVSRASWFMELVDAGTPPDIDESDATSKAILSQFPSPTPKTVAVLPERYDRFGAMLERVKGRRKRVEDIERKLASTIKAGIGNAEYGVTPNGLAWKWGARGKTRALTAVSALHPEILKGELVEP